MDRIRVAIIGYGNVGRGVESGIKRFPDLELVGIFSKRDPASVKPRTGAKVYSINDLENMKNDIDVCILCGGSAFDLPVTSPKYASMFNIVDSFDTHAKVPEHFANLDAAAKKSGKVAVMSVGWDPGMFSINRIYGECILPDAKTYTFWGKGISQGHSEAIRNIEGVEGAMQYTIPVDSAIDAVRSGKNPELSTREKHKRECFVVAKEGADKAAIENTIKTMPNYFDEYDTTVHFITMEELKRDHSEMPHGGFVFRSGVTGYDDEHKAIIEYSLNLDSNPEFTSSVLLAYARAACKMNREGMSGCKTVFDIAPCYLSNKTPEELRKGLL